MTEHLRDLERTCEAILRRHATGDARQADGGGFGSTLWKVLEESGMTTIGDAGNDTGVAEAAVLARVTGRFAAAVPLVESGALASWILSTAGIPVPDGYVTSAVVHPLDEVTLERRDGGWHLSARLHRVPWGREAQTVALVATVGGTPHAVLAPVGETLPGANLAGEPRDTLLLDTAVDAAESPVGATGLRHRAALLRAASMVGAMESARDLAVGHAAVRQQFGKPISAFQAIQHHLAGIAAETLCAAMAVDLAVAAEGEQHEFAVAAAKVTAGRAAGVVARSAHQVHGAIGVTQEHSLPWFTTRLWSWQDELGTAAAWAEVVGGLALAAGPDGVWPLITRSAGGES